MLARRAGDLEGAVGALERMLIYNPDLPIIRYELARLYARLGSIEAAKALLPFCLALQAAAKNPGRISRLRSLVWTKRRSPSSFSGSVFLGLQYQTNGNLAPDDPAVQVGGGQRSQTGRRVFSSNPISTAMSLSAVHSPLRPRPGSGRIRGQRLAGIRLKATRVRHQQYRSCRRDGRSEFRAIEQIRNSSLPSRQLGFARWWNLLPVLGRRRRDPTSTVG